LVIPTIPFHSPFWQALTRCDYFSESQENDGSDICKFVGDIGNPRLRILLLNFKGYKSACPIFFTTSHSFSLIHTNGSARAEKITRYFDFKMIK
jgi:hypothetical protein